MHYSILACLFGLLMHSPSILGIGCDADWAKFDNQNGTDYVSRVLKDDAAAEPVTLAMKLRFGRGTYNMPIGSGFKIEAAAKKLQRELGGKIQGGMTLLMKKTMIEETVTWQRYLNENFTYLHLAKQYNFEKKKEHAPYTLTVNHTGSGKKVHHFETMQKAEAYIDAKGYDGINKKTTVNIALQVHHQGTVKDAHIELKSNDVTWDPKFHVLLKIADVESIYLGDAVNIKQAVRTLQRYAKQGLLYGPEIILANSKAGDIRLRQDGYISEIEFSKIDPTKINSVIEGLYHLDDFPIEGSRDYSGLEAIFSYHVPRGIHYPSYVAQFVSAYGRRQNAIEMGLDPLKKRLRSPREALKISEEGVAALANFKGTTLRQLQEIAVINHGKANATQPLANVLIGNLTTSNRIAIAPRAIAAHFHSKSDSFLENIPTFAIHLKFLRNFHGRILKDFQASR